MPNDTKIPPSQLRKKVNVWLKRPLAHKIKSITDRVKTQFNNFENLVIEKWHGLEFGGYITNSELITNYSTSLPHATAYSAAPFRRIRKLINEAEKTGLTFQNFIDIGSGKGKACFYAAKKYNFKKIIGVEFSKPLVDIAEINKKKFGSNNLIFFNADATEFILPPGNNLIFIFNPFDGVTLERFLENNINHFKENKSVIAYANDQHRICLTKIGFETIFRNQTAKDSLFQYP